MNSGSELCNLQLRTPKSELLKDMMGTSTTVITTESRTLQDLTPLVANGITMKSQVNANGNVNTNNNNTTTHTNTTNDSKYKHVYVWRNIIIFLYVHLYGIYGFYLLCNRNNFPVLLFQTVYGFLGGIGITAGAHRLWAHRSYKAKWPLRVLLGIFQTIAFQNHIYEWSRDHRVHHKFSETDADPHNARRGFFFSHIGWLLVRKHEDVRLKGKVVDMSDLEKDFVVIWQRRLYGLLMPLLTFVFPTWVSMHFWGLSFYTAWYGTLWRWAMSLNCTWLVNSAAHMWGNRPYDRNISPAENIMVATLAYGEGWHNYHHTFPYDYKAAELGNYSFNYTTGFIDLFARIGWAYDLKTVSENVIRKRVARTGDGSHEKFCNNSPEEVHEEHVWGWGDKDMEKSEIKDVTILNAKSE